ncbi:ABC transporter permease subunit [Streptomyces sp. NPDC002138]|uniref:ABC transporter permease n=1 Tax=Streptomyces sp. NPDC002138 TaxID=3154410 RepID=UPI003324129B
MSASAHTTDRAAADRAGARDRPRRLRGLAWLIARQHRTVLIVCAAVTVLGALWIVYQRAAMLDTLHAAGWPATPAGSIDPDVYTRTGNDFESHSGVLAGLSALFGVFLGVPLIAGDRESGTARLVATQSVSRGQWLRWKLGFALVLVTVTVGTLSMLHSWWWRSVQPFAAGSWLQGRAFDTTGPMLLATALFALALGIAVGVVVRRTVAAMALTYVGTWVATIVVSYFRERLATPHVITYPFGGPSPVLDRAAQTDQWVGTASGKLYGYGTCVHDAAPDACRSGLGIVNSVWEYFSYDQMATIQWTEAGIYLALAAALTALAVWWARRFPL